MGIQVCFAAGFIVLLLFSGLFVYVRSRETLLSKQFQDAFETAQSRFKDELDAMRLDVAELKAKVQERRQPAEAITSSMKRELSVEPVREAQPEPQIGHADRELLAKLSSLRAFSKKS